MLSFHKVVEQLFTEVCSYFGSFILSLTPSAFSQLNKHLKRHRKRYFDCLFFTAVAKCPAQLIPRDGKTHLSFICGEIQE